MLGRRFQLEADSAANEWLEAHPAFGPRVISYDIHRCCGGGKICQVRVREGLRKDDRREYATGEMDDGTEFLIDNRAAAKLHLRFGLTVRGLGPLRHLDLDLKSEQWGDLLYS